jgi:hypothetical protein
MATHLVDKLALEYVTSDGLPAHFACWKSCDAVLSVVKKTELQERANQLGFSVNAQSTAQILKSIAAFLIAKGSVPQHMVSLRLLHDKTRPPQELTCWKCGMQLTECPDGMVDFKVGSWPPGDSRRWRIEDSFVVPVMICTNQKATTCSRRSEPSDPPGTDRAGAFSPCTVGDFRTISHIHWNQQFNSLSNIMRLNGPGLQDGLIPCPLGPCIERICLQILNWFSMSGQDIKDKNYLPARVYLTREAKLVCRGGSVVGFVTFNSQASTPRQRSSSSSSTTHTIQPRAVTAARAIVAVRPLLPPPPLPTTTTTVIAVQDRV